MDKSAPLNAQDVDALKSEIAGVVDTALANAEGMTRADALKAAAEAVDKLEGESPADDMGGQMGGMGTGKDMLAGAIQSQDQAAGAGQ